MDATELDKIFSALADSTRRAILAKLASGEASVSELAEPFHLTQPAISKHLKVLQDADLISSQVEKQRRPRRLNPKALAKAVDWLERYREICERNYAKLDTLLAELQQPSSKQKPKKSKDRRES